MNEMIELNEQKIVVIPAKSCEEIQRTKRLKVAAYCRVSTDEEEQETSYEAQISYYTEKIKNNVYWTLAGIFADEGISGTQAKKRPEFLRMIKLCRQRKIDLILTKSLSRFARNTVDSLNYIRELKSLNIAVYFEKENINTLTAESEMLTTIMSCFAQAESESISKNVAWGIRQSFKNGNVPIRYASLLGYKKGSDGKPEIVSEEAEIDNKPVGAVWVRIMNDYGHIDDDTPSFAISLYKDYRGMGMGTALMKEMLCILKDRGYKQASLAVQKANYAVRMYQKTGFEIVDENDEEYIMLCRL